MEENLNKKLENKGYICEGYECKCRFHQIKELGIKEENIPNLGDNKRIGIIKTLSVVDCWDTIESNPLEKIEIETTVLKKYWHRSLGKEGDLIVILEKSEKVIGKAEEIEEKLDDIVKFVHGTDKEFSEYNKKVIEIGIKSLFELGEITHWDKSVYLLYDDINSTGESAGVPLLLSFYSAYYGIGIPNDFSATGEIDEEGNVKGVESLKEKVICAVLSEEINNLILPRENYEKIPRIPNGSKQLNFYPLSHWRDLKNLLFNWKTNR